MDRSPWKPGPRAAGSRRGPPRGPRSPGLPLTDEQRDLAERFLPLARKLAHPFKARFPRMEDEFDSAACLALVEAARLYDPSRNLRFVTFAWQRIRGRLLDAQREMGPRGWASGLEDAPRLVSLTAQNQEDGRMLVAHQADEVGADVDAVDAVEHWLSKLPGQYARTCRLYYLHGKTMSEIAGELGCSPSEVARQHQVSLKLLSGPGGPSGRKTRSPRRRGPTPGPQGGPHE